MEITKRTERICFRTGKAHEQEICRLARFMALPRSAVVFLLVGFALESLAGIDTKEAWWTALSELPMADLHAALRQEVYE